ncbi:2-hydroxyacid dehydrogenase [Metabacillus arenae]|uniref:D-glycerate dehydrogenase n=1 Tax=Metabacillus arenae TaxID=2771434 RepID=A0A926RWC9_9BACI|nr:D-glycerate dehydrogenase [Metabacillus arenae]MBD1379786.1 D-glycerate dehydrogenase [Metabacillus arenae]
MKPKVYITRKIPSSILEKMQEVCEVRMWEKEDIPVPYEVLEKEIDHVDGLFCLLTETIDEALMIKAKNLKIISNMAVGYNNIDVKAATHRGIMVTNTPEVLTETTADLTFALLMSTARRIPESMEYLKNGKWKTWSPMQLTGQDVFGATLGIIGLGRIGEALVKRAKGFDMNILYYNRSRKTDKEYELGIQYTELETLLKQSDFICVMTPLTPATINLIDKKELSLMKKTAVLINTARGGIVNESALYEALINGDIWGAGLDVFENEPVSTEHSLLTLPNVVALPHIGSASIKTRLKMAEVASENLIQGLTNSVPKNLVNKETLNLRA